MYWMTTTLQMEIQSVVVTSLYDLFMIGDETDDYVAKADRRNKKGLIPHCLEL